MTASHRLPVRPTMRPGEDLAYFLTRCAEANGLTLRGMTGFPIASPIWTQPSAELLEQLAELTDSTAPHLRAATVRQQFPNALLTRRQIGGRGAGHIPKCPTCAMAPAAARLELVVLCPTCGSMLVDGHAPRPPEYPATLADVQEDVVSTMHAVKSSRQASLRMVRLEALMRAQEPALRMDFPDLVAGETPEWRKSAAVLAQEITGRGGKGPRPPSLNAALLLLCWPASADESDSQRRLVDCAIASDPAARRCPLRFEVGPERDTALADLGDFVRLHDVKWQHVPSALRHRDDPRILDPRVLPHRTAQALALSVVVSSPYYPYFSERTVASAAWRLGHAAAPTVREATLVLANSADALKQLLMHAQALVESGLDDLDARRREFAQLKRLPYSATRGLPAAARANADPSSVAAAWVWLDATQGRLSGGPHPHMRPVRVRQFDKDLNAEGRLALREWWQQRLMDAQFTPLDAPGDTARDLLDWAV